MGTARAHKGKADHLARGKADLAGGTKAGRLRGCTTTGANEAATPWGMRVPVPIPRAPWGKGAEPRLLFRCRRQAGSLMLAEAQHSYVGIRAGLGEPGGTAAGTHHDGGPRHGHRYITLDPNARQAKEDGRVLGGQCSTPTISRAGGSPAHPNTPPPQHTTLRSPSSSRLILLQEITKNSRGTWDLSAPPATSS